MPKSFRKTDAFIAPVTNDLNQDPPPDVGDIDSGMQRSTNSGIIGVATESIVNAPGQTIGAAAPAADYHVSI